MHSQVVADVHIASLTAATAATLLLSLPHWHTAPETLRDKIRGIEEFLWRQISQRRALLGPLQLHLHQVRVAVLDKVFHAYGGACVDARGCGSGGL